MGCGGCNHRRVELGKAVKAIRAGQVDKAAVQVKVATRSLGEDAKGFARGLKARLVRR